MDIAAVYHSLDLGKYDIVIILLLLFAITVLLWCLNDSDKYRYWCSLHDYVYIIMCCIIILFFVLHDITMYRQYSILK